MSVRRLQQRVPTARALLVAVLRRHRLAFHKAGRDGSAKCDALSSGLDEDAVHGVLYRMDARDRPQLDVVEGLGCGYERKKVTLWVADEKELSAFTYCATHIDATLRPYPWYIEHVLRGAREHNLPDHYLAKIAAVPTLDDPDPQRHAMELDIYPSSIPLDHPE